MSGKGKGRDDAVHLLTALDTVNTEADIVAAIARLHVDMTDDRSVFALEPLRFALALTPSWLMWEQVPAVLPIWEACAGVLRRIGYSVDTGILHAEQFGVPQTRRRAILVAHAPWVSTPAKLPTPTHSRFHPRHPGKLDSGVDKWVSMAEALGWGMTERPSMTVTGGGTGKGGAEPFGNGARQGMRRELEAGRWLFAGAGATAQFTAQQRPRELTEPAHTITGKGTAAWIPKNPTAEGVTTLRVTVEEAAALQSFPDGYPWQGTKTQQFRQCGDAVPPRLAAAILKPILEAVSRDSPRAVAA
jgi:DNA (cytosine-5)-methyltransferase 1